MMPRSIIAATLIGASVLSASDQKSVEALNLAQQQIEKRDLVDAWRTIQNALTQAPDDAGILNLRGVVHAQRGELTEAREDFATAVKSNPKLIPAWKNLGRACQQLNQRPCALEAWQKVVIRAPADDEAHAALSQLYEEGGDFSRSLRELNATSSDNMPLRCLDLSGLNRAGEAKELAKRLAKQSDFQEADFESMHGPIDKPNAAEVLAVLAEGLDSRGLAGKITLQRLGVAYEQLKRPGDARKVLERVAILDPENSAHLLELARLAEGAEDHEGALGYLAHARDLEPNNARIHFLFGAIAGEMNLPIEAKQSLDKALAIDPNNPNYNYAMGSVILQTRDAATAASYFLKYVDAQLTDERGHYALGLAYFTAGDYLHAKEEMLKAKESKSLAAQSDYYLGRMARLDGSLDEAIVQLRDALILQPKFSEPHTELGRIAMLRGEMALAHSELEQAVQLSPQSFQANEQLLILYKRTHDPKSAAQEETLKKLDEERSKRAELMLRTLDMRP